MPRRKKKVWSLEAHLKKRVRYRHGLPQTVHRRLRLDLAASPPLLLQSVVTPLRKTDDGEIVRVAMLPWQAIVQEILRDPAFLHTIDWRKMEELVAATYDAAGFDEVTLTPRSGDDGRDVIAVKRGL